ncbi:MAG: hypothetical protein U5K29_09030 [Acidimicrobiales bacterium]|nr:hypothetical protein [Acidimicrobiales bacterium]
MGSPEPPASWDQIAEQVAATARDAAAVGVGLGILGLNRLQALRRDLTAKLDEVVRPPAADTDSSEE